MRYSLPFGLGGAVNTAEEEDDLRTELMTTLIVEQFLALPESANKLKYRGFLLYG